MNRLNCLALIACLIACLIQIGCDNRQANQRPQRKQVTQTIDKKTSEQLRNITGRNKVQDETDSDAAEAKQEDSKQSDASQQSPKQSPLDRASQNLENQAVVERPEKKIEKREVHKDLLPLIEDDWQRFGEQYEVWFDPKTKQVIVGGRISVSGGMPLEMFACPAGTNEHESVIATISDARSIHACLLAVGAIPGTPAYWTEETGVVTAIGPTCDIKIVWNAPPTEPDEEVSLESRKEVSAKEFILNERTGEVLKDDWVFCGSRLWTDPNDTSYVEYQADGGFMICVTNFPSAMLDLTIESSTSDASRMFVANPDKIPSLGQPVLIVITPDISTNPDPEVVAAAVKQRDEAQARMNAEMEIRMKKREEEWARRDAERAKAKADAKSSTKSDSKSKSGAETSKDSADNTKGNAVEKSTGENEKDDSKD